jgi:hypothetical protein
MKITKEQEVFLKDWSRNIKDQNYSHFSIDRYHRSQWWNRNRKWFVILIISLAILFTLWWIGTANAEMNSNYYQQVHVCVENYKAVNQIGVRPLQEVGQCTHNPTVIL